MTEFFDRLCGSVDDYHTGCRRVIMESYMDVITMLQCDCSVSIHLIPGNVLMIFIFALLRIRTRRRWWMPQECLSHLTVSEEEDCESYLVLETSLLITMNKESALGGQTISSQSSILCQFKTRVHVLNKRRCCTLAGSFSKSSISPLLTNTQSSKVRDSVSFV